MKKVQPDENHFILSTVINYPDDFEFLIHLVPNNIKDAKPMVITNFDELLSFFEDLETSTN